MAGRPAVEVESLSKWYPLRRGLGTWLRAPMRRDTIRALYQVRFTLSRGEILALLGPNGSGKSTLLKILSGLVLPTEGKARVDGMDVMRRSIATRSRIGVCMSEERSFYYRLTGRRNLRFFGRLLAVPPVDLEREIDEAAELLGIREIDERFMTYSTGTRQKLCVARSLLGERPILLLDEPTRGLDPHTASRLLRRLRSLARDEGRAVLLASHDLEAVDRVADRLIFLHRGELLAEGAPEEVLERFRIPREILIEVREPRDGWEEELASLAGVEKEAGDERECPPGACRVRIDEDEFSLDRFLAAVRERWGGARRLEVRRGSLEELYRRFAEADR